MIHPAALLVVLATADAGAAPPAHPAANAQYRPLAAQTCPIREPVCTESCALPNGGAEKPSAQFLAKLGAIKPTRHHIDSRFGPALVERLERLTVLNVGGLLAGGATRWQLNRRYAGPCTGLVTVFWSKAVEDADDANVVDMYELRYPDAAAARRVHSLLTFPSAKNWDWNYHPYSAALDDRSVFVIEGRWRAWSAFKSVAAHFGAPIVDRQKPPVLPPCGPSPEGKPLLARDAKDGQLSLSVYALGFSTAGRLAWLEQRTGAGGRGVEWSIQIVDLINDRPLPGKTFRVAGDVAAMCARNGAEVTTLLGGNDIQPGVDLVLEQPSPGRDPTGVELRPAARSGSTDVVLRAAAGEKRIGTLTHAGAAAAPSVLGFLRSPFEPRVAVAVSQPTANARRNPAIRFFGGRLDKRWQPATPSAP